jgi:parallel beta-helix repeat protein
MMEYKRHAWRKKIIPKGRNKNVRKKMTVIGILLVFTGVMLAPCTTSDSPRPAPKTTSGCPLILLDEPGTLSGYVTDTEMSPIQGAYIRVDFHDTYRENYSDATGYYHVTDIPLCYCMKNATCSKPGYIPASVSLAITENTTYDFILTSASPWLYVGGGGLGNYTKIQDAIDNASKDDTVFVYDDSSPYHENLRINQTITLQGENMETTIIDGTEGPYEHLIEITAPEVTLTGFCIYPDFPNNISSVVFLDQANRTRIMENIFQNTSEYSSSMVYLLHTTYAQIINNTFKNNSVGISIYYGGDHRIEGNIFMRNKLDGIDIVYSNGNTIYQNTIVSSGHFAIICEGSHYNAFVENTINDNEYGFAAEISCQNLFSRNTFMNNTIGMSLINSQGNTIEENNFINNTNQTEIQYFGAIGRVLSILLKLRFSREIGFFSLFGPNHWEANYWSDCDSTAPRAIDQMHYLVGLQIVLGKFTDKLFLFHTTQYDRHPAQEPYLIED